MLEIDLICKFVIGFALGERDFQYSDKDIKILNRMFGNISIYNSLKSDVE